jgi:hypothetical protein
MNHHLQVNPHLIPHRVRGIPSNLPLNFHRVRELPLTSH